MKISIIVTVYNVEKYLEKCLKSLVNQTYKNIEIIIVNDGTKDDSQLIIDKFKKQYPKIIKSYIIENRGLGGARNYALEQATGDYIMYVDSDDYIENNMTEKLYKSICAEDSDVAICGYNVVSEDTGEILNVVLPSSKDNYSCIYDIMHGRTSVWNKLYKKDLLIKNGIVFRSKIWYEDVDFSLKVAFSTKKISIVDEPLYNYLIREGSIMNNNNIKRNLELCLSFDEIISYCKRKDIFEKYKKEIEFACIYHLYICGISRVICSNNKMQEKKIIINSFKEYIRKEFKDFEKNEYLVSLDRNKKIAYKLIKHNKYRTLNFLFSLKRSNI